MAVQEVKGGRVMRSDLFRRYCGTVSFGFLYVCVAYIYICRERVSGQGLPDDAHTNDFWLVHVCEGELSTGYVEFPCCFAVKAIWLSRRVQIQNGLLPCPLCRLCRHGFLPPQDVRMHGMDACNSRHHEQGVVLYVDVLLLAVHAAVSTLQKSFI